MMDQIVQDAKLEYIPLSKLNPSPLNTYDSTDIEDLLGSIKSCGLLTPLTVSGPDDNGIYEILSGERRYKALSTLHNEDNSTYESAPCYICNTRDQYEKQLIIESSNLETRDFDKNEHRLHILEILKQMADEGSIKHQEIVKEAGKYMNCSERYRRMYMEIFKNDNDELNQLVKEKKVTVAHASRLAGLDKEKQDDAIDRINQGENAKDILDEYVEKKKEESEDKSFEDIPTGESGSKEDKKPAAPNPYGDYSEAFEDEDFAKLIDNEDMDKIGEAFFKGASNIDPNLETVPGGRLKELKKEEVYSNSEEEDREKAEKRAKDVCRWCDMMMKKTEFTNAEEEAFEKMQELMEYVGL